MMHADATTVGVRFRVQKGSSFDFECSSNAAWQAQSSEIRKLFHRIEEIEALQLSLLDWMDAPGFVTMRDTSIEQVSIAKRLELGDVDRMITLCRQHPPQCAVSPATMAHAVAFQEFSAYLKQRQRAGVATLANGYLLLLTPIPGWDNYLRCLVIKSKTNELDAESVSSLASMRSEEDANGSILHVPTRKESHPMSPRSDEPAAQVAPRVSCMLNADVLAILLCYYGRGHSIDRLKRIPRSLQHSFRLDQKQPVLHS